MAYDIEVVELDPQPVLVVEAADVEAPKLGEVLAGILPRVHHYITENEIEMAGRPFMRYLDMTDRFSIDAGIGTASEASGSGDIVAKVLPGGKAATTLHLGPYHTVGAAWDAITAWAAEQGIEHQWGGWDVYENDPTEVADPSEIQTRIFYPLAP